WAKGLIRFTLCGERPSRGVPCSLDPILPAPRGTIEMVFNLWGGRASHLWPLNHDRCHRFAGALISGPILDGSGATLRRRRKTLTRPAHEHARRRGSAGFTGAKAVFPSLGSVLFRSTFYKRARMPQGPNNQVTRRSAEQTFGHLPGNETQAAVLPAREFRERSSPPPLGFG